jgi:inorganic pyrophosphatase
MKHLPPGPPGRVPHVVHVMVEIPTGSRIKYEMDHETGMVFVDRVLFSPFHYPAEYGFIPSTLAPDGDPCDALVLITGPPIPA